LHRREDGLQNWLDVLGKDSCPCQNSNPGPSSPQLHHYTDNGTPTLQGNAGAEIYGWQTVVNCIITDLLVTKLQFKKLKLSLWVTQRYVCDSAGIASVILKLGTLPTLCVRGKSPWNTFSTKLVVAYSQFWCQLKKDMHLKIILHNVILLQNILLTCKVQSVGYCGRWGVEVTVLLNSVTYS
jgi:hypothetical protein